MSYNALSKILECKVLDKLFPSLLKCQKAFYTKLCVYFQNVTILVESSQIWKVSLW